MKVKVKTMVFNPRRPKSNKRNSGFYCARRFEDGVMTVFSVMSDKKGR